MYTLVPYHGLIKRSREQRRKIKIEKLKREDQVETELQKEKITYREKQERERLT